MDLWSHLIFSSCFNKMCKNSWHSTRPLVKVRVWADPAPQASAGRCSARDAPPSPCGLALGSLCLRAAWAACGSVKPELLGSEGQAPEWVVVIWLGPLPPLASVSWHKRVWHWGNICQVPCIVRCTCQVLLSFETLVCARLRACGCHFRKGEAPEPWDRESAERDDGSGPG